MNNRIFLLVTLVFLNLCILQLQAIDPFSKCITGTTYRRINNFPYNNLSMDVTYTYTNTNPPLLSTMFSTTTTITDFDTTTVEVLSTYEGSVDVVNDMMKVEYYEYRDNIPGYYGYFKFLFNPEGDLMEFQVIHPNIPDSLHAYFHYRATNQPDSMYYMKSVNPNITFYKLFYDANDRLSYSLQYLYDTVTNTSSLYRRFSQSYAENPYQYQSPLDFNNHRFYNMSGNWNGAFEESTPIYDKNFATQQIMHQQWDSWYQEWYNVGTSVYGVDTSGENIALLEGQPGSYSGHYYFDEHGSYIGRHTDNYDGTYNDYNIYWLYRNETGNHDTPAINHPMIVYPNPFRNSLNIRLTDKNNPASEISIFNVKGQLIRSLKHIKSTELNWDGKDNSQQAVPGGIYLIKAKQGRSITTAKVIKY